MTEPVFFVDRALGGKIFPSALAGAGVQVEIHHNHFDPDEDDEVWIEEVAQRGWFALSNDRRIYVNPVQRDAVIRAGLGYFLLTSANSSAAVLADNFIQTYPVVLRFIGRIPRPFVASVRRPDQPGRSGTVRRLYPKP